MYMMYATSEHAEYNMSYGRTCSNYATDAIKIPPYSKTEQKCPEQTTVITVIRDDILGSNKTLKLNRNSLIPVYIARSSL